MNDDRVQGEVTDIGGKLKETAGNLTGDQQLQGQGLSDQLSGKAQKVFGAAKDAVDPGPLVDKAKGFAKSRPWATAALAGVVGVALLNTLRGKGRA